MSVCWERGREGAFEGQQNQDWSTYRDTLNLVVLATGVVGSFDGDFFRSGNEWGCSWWRGSGWA